MTSHAPSALLLPLWAKTDEIFNLRGFIVQSRRCRNFHRFIYIFA